jgi:Zn-finger nucleic acid-binding protein
MAAYNLNCVMCGAPAGPEATKCGHCGSRLAVISCPKCFAHIQFGHVFCPECGGAVVERSAQPDPKGCPRCLVPLTRVDLGDVSMCECEQCSGLWLDKAEFQRIVVSTSKEVVPGEDTSGWKRPPRPLEQVRYIRCPVCNEFMNRANFAASSGAILDSCHVHGTWFDQDELRHVVAFIRSGGLEKARVREAERLRMLKQSTAGCVGHHETESTTALFGPELLLDLLWNFPDIFS